jgi:gliding motility-associated-like protein
VLVKMLCAESRVAIPNAFAPNGNGKNDVFIIKGISVVKHLMIFNRWGQKVFERKNFIASDRSMCWDGTFNGYPAAEGTYVYFAEMQCPSGGTFSRKGTVVLVR